MKISWFNNTGNNSLVIAVKTGEKKNKPRFTYQRFSDEIESWSIRINLSCMHLQSVIVIIT